MRENLISVIVPVYNLEKELPRCLDSILAQTLTDLEIIVVDDGSQDGSAEVLRQYARQDHRIKPIFQTNGGVTAARLRGASEASGEWIGFVDGDDEIEPNMYQRLLSNALKYDADISHCGYQMVFDDGRINYFHNTGTVTKQDQITALRELLSGKRIEPGLCNKLFHKNLFQSLLHDKAMPVGIKINEDLLMNYHLFLAAEQTVFDDWCPYHYIVRSTSASRTKLNEHRIYDPIRVKALIRDSAPAEIQEDAQRAYLNTCINVWNTLTSAGQAYDLDGQKVCKLLKSEESSFSVLGSKRRLIAWAIVHTPFAYKLIRSVYCRFFQKNVYS